MNTRYLEEYLLFAEELNWSTASEKLFITRPTLVDHLRALESELECKLVASDRKQVALTPAGKQFVQTARDLLGQWSAVCSEYRDLADNLLTVTIAASNLPWLESIIYKARRTIHERYPYKRIEVISANGTLANIEALDDGTNDIVVAGFKSYRCEGDEPPIPEQYRSFPLRTEEIRMLVTQENRLFDKERIYVRDLDGMTFMLPPDIYKSWTRDGMVGRLAERGAHVTLRTTEFSDHVEYFNYNFGDAVGIVPLTLAPRYGIDTREEFRAFTLADWTVESRFYAVCREEFAATENGGLLFEEMRRIAGGRG